ncbi:MAG: 6-phosphofructokinase [Clostridiales bacterium]|nr:MAG: 6-phosphofructokinase [Clostridiales bacterium]
MKKIAILTSGGDAPGMNAAIRSAVRMGIHLGYEMVAIERGYQGLLEKKLFTLKTTDVSDMLFRGGTFIRTARSEEFKSEEGSKKGFDILKKNGIDSLIVIGGDGSFKGARSLHERGIKTVALPGTIDNDLGYTDYTIGFDTAITTVMDAVSKLRDTSSSHSKVFVVEVMGRNCGDIALYAGLISGAEEVIIPEIEYDFEKTVENIKRGFDRGKNHYIILLAEGAFDPFKYTEKLQKRISIPTRLSVIGYLQRGGAPTAFDRLLATKMGAEAVRLIDKGKSGVAVGIKGNKIVNVEIKKAINTRDEIDRDLYDLAEIIAR